MFFHDARLILLWSKDIEKANAPPRTPSTVHSKCQYVRVFKNRIGSKVFRGSTILLRGEVLLSKFLNFNCTYSSRKTWKCASIFYVWYLRRVKNIIQKNFSRFIFDIIRQCSVILYFIANRISDYCIF